MGNIIGFRDLKELFKTEKFIKFALIIGFILIALTAFSGMFGSRNTDSTKSADYTSMERTLEKRLADVLSNVEGMGKTDIMVTLDSSERKEFAGTKDTPSGVKMPQVRGVIVVCDGGNDIIVREKVINAVAGVFGISTARVSVIK